MKKNKTLSKIHITYVENQNLYRTMILIPINSNNKIDNILEKAILLSPILID